MSYSPHALADGCSAGDLEDPDWPDFRAKLEQVTRLLEKVRARVGGS